MLLTAGIVTLIGLGLVWTGAAQTVTPSTAPRLVWADKYYIDRSGRPSPDGRYFAHQTNDGNLALRDLASGEERPLTRDASATTYASWATFSPGGSQIAYKWGDSLRQISVGGTNSKVLYSGSDSMLPGSYSPDAKQFLFNQAVHDPDLTWKQSRDLR